MNTLDERILIAATPAFVWDHISDISRNPTWQVDCTSVSFLTTFHKGPGVRWRYSSKSRHDYVVQVTAWYEGLGYEYTIVDGVPYRQNMGRVRLQEIPEGTIVQWTFSYELGGALSGLRDAMGHKRTVNNTMIDSLKKLWLYMKHVDRGNVVREPKSLMRDAPDVEERANYKPRHPSAVPATPQPTDEKLSLLTEPPIADDDTRPRPAVRSEFAPPEPAPAPEVPSKVSTAEHAAAVVAPEPAKPTETEPDFLSAVRATQDMIPAPTEEEPAPPAPVSQEVANIPAVKPPDEVSDTSKVSVFELFGLPKPSETQEMHVVTSTSLPMVMDIAPAPVLESNRRGMRILLRGRRVRVRRP